MYNARPATFSSVLRAGHLSTLLGQAGSSRAHLRCPGPISQEEHPAQLRAYPTTYISPILLSHSIHSLLFAHSVGVHNQSHPRTDPVVIMAVVNESNDKILLGRNVRPIPIHARRLYTFSTHSAQTIAKMAGQVLLYDGRLHRTRRILRRRRQTRAVGGSWPQGLGRPLPFYSTMGTYNITHLHPRSPH